jgi:uncharacterized low-complexity protein
MKKMIKTPLATVMGTAFVSAMSVTAVQADSNPFEMTEMSSGYMQLAEAKKEGSCGEGKCGSSMNMEEPKMPEGKCAGKKAMPAPAAETKAKEASCGEGKCGAMMEKGKMKKGMEGSCGDMMKGKEGSCGDMVNKDEAAGK